MDLGGRIIIVFILGVVAVHLFELNEQMHNFLSSILSIPDIGYVENESLYHLGKICIFIIAVVAVLKVLSSKKEDD